MVMGAVCFGQTVPVVMLSDLHFDPLRDPGKAARLAAAPVGDWAEILRGPATPGQAAGFAAIQAKCGSKRGEDSDFELMGAALRAAAAQADKARWVTVSGDLVAHELACRWKLATGGDQGYEAFHEETAAFVIRQVEAAFRGVPVYVALGNNDSSCGDYRIDLHDRYLAATAGAVLDGLVGTSREERAKAAADYTVGGYFAVSLPELSNGRLLVVDDLFLSRRYKTCAGKADVAAGAAVLGWLRAQLEEAKERGEAVWVLGHIPPGVDVYSTVVKFRDVCGGEAPEMFLSDDALGDLLAKYAGTVRLGVFGHTHEDEVRLVGGVPVKVVGSVTPVNGNLPSFTVGTVNRRTGMLVDYAVYTASKREGVGAWKREYGYRETYGEAEFTAGALRDEIAGFKADAAGEGVKSTAYQEEYFPGSASPLGLVWPQAVCGMGEYTAVGYRGCVCKP